MRITVMTPTTRRTTARTTARVPTTTAAKEMGYSNSYDNNADDSRNGNISRDNIKSANDKCSKTYGQHQQ